MLGNRLTMGDAAVHHGGVNAGTRRFAHLAAHRLHRALAGRACVAEHLGHHRLKRCVQHARRVILTGRLCRQGRKVGHLPRKAAQACVARSQRLMRGDPDIGKAARGDRWHVGCGMPYEFQHQLVPCQKHRARHVGAVGSKRRPGKDQQGQGQNLAAI